MTASAENSPELASRPLFVIAIESRPQDEAWTAALDQVREVRTACGGILGFDPDVRLAFIDDATIAPVQDAREIFLLPAPLDLGLWQRSALGQLIAEWRRKFPDAVIHHDDVDPCHPLVVSAFANQAGRAIAGANTAPQQCGLILAASGDGDPASRAQSYRLMRLIWEELGLARAEVGFVRHVQPFLPHVLERCAHENFHWVIVPQAQWNTGHVEYARVMLENFQRSNPQAAGWVFVDPPAGHATLTAWYTQRIVCLWGQKREREALRRVSARSVVPGTKAIWSCGNGMIARVPGRDALAETLARILPAEKPERVLVKVTWHGYATGTYTDPAALDLLLGALPAPAVILEGHTCSRNRGGSDFDWETQARENRAWIRQQEADYLRSTGLAEVLARHQAQYLNITEAWWDDSCACRCEIEAALREHCVELAHPELSDFIPKALLQFRGCPMISFAKMKGPTRLGISNLFGLIPAPLRDAWHGPNLTWFARVCCDLAKLYGSLFELCGMVEGLYTAVRWNRQGLYRSRWGNYDLIQDAGCLTASRGLVSADILASRLQGQDVARSGFFDVVRQELAWDSGAAAATLPEAIGVQFL